MRNFIVKVFGYVFLRSLLFLGMFHSVNKSAKMVKWSDLQNREDWFYFFWLFMIPIIAEVILLGLPMAYGLGKMPNSINKFPLYLLFIGLFMIEFIVANWLYGTPASYWKISISLVLLLLFFRKRLF